MDEKPTNLYREEKKRELRSRVIDTPLDEEVLEEKLRRHRRVVTGIFLAVVVAAIIVAILIIARNNVKHFNSYSVSQTYDLALTGEYSYVPFGGSVVCYGKNSASYLNDGGEIVWTKAYDMANPIVDVCGDYLAIADQRGTTIVIFDKTGSLGTATTAIPISRISIAGQGMVSAILEADVANYIMFYNKTGQQLNIEMKTLISGNGYPLGIDLSPSGAALMASYVGVEGEGLKDKILFYNFEVGQDQVDRLIGGFEHYDKTLIADVHFFNESTAVAIGDDTISFYQFETEKKVDLGTEIGIEDKIYDVFYSDQFVGLVFHNGSSDNSPYELKVYNTVGKEMLDLPFSYGYDSIYFYEDEVVMYNNSSIAVYYVGDGSVKFTSDLESNYKVIVPGNSRDQYLTIGSEVMQVLKLEP